MGMSTHVYGIVPADTKFKKMKAIYDQCREADVDIPDAVDKFFNGETPDDKGVLLELKSTEYSNDDCDEYGIEVDLRKIPEHVKIIRFVNSY